MDKVERMRLGDETRNMKVDMILSLGIDSPRTLAEIMFDLGRAYGLQEASEIMKDNNEPQPPLQGS